MLDAKAPSMAPPAAPMGQCQQRSNAPGFSLALTTDDLNSGSKKRMIAGEFPLSNLG
jgi:hypothetical protein